MGYLIALGHIAMIFMGAPLFAALGSLTLCLMWLDQEFNLQPLIIEIYRGLSAPTLIAIPLFTFAGFLISKSRSPQRIVNFAQSLIGWLPGGLALMVLFLSSFFTAFTGASGVTIIALGALSYKALSIAGYSESFKLGFVTTCGSLGLLFAPSLPIILYGLFSETSVDHLFIAGLVPGLLLIAILYLYAIGFNLKGVKRIPFSFSNVLKTGREAMWEIPMPIIILWGIYGGYFSATEAGAVTALYAFIVEVFIHREVNVGDIFVSNQKYRSLQNEAADAANKSFEDKDFVASGLMSVGEEAMVLKGSFLIILACALGLTAHLVDQEVPDRMFEWLQTFISSKITFLLILNVFLILVGMIMDIFSAVIVVAPLITPMAVNFGVDPVHLGIMFLCNIEIGYNFPPFGMNLIIASQRFNKSILEVSKATLPFTLLLIVGLLLLTYVPEISLFLLPAK